MTLLFKFDEAKPKAVFSSSEISFRTPIGTLAFSAKLNRRYLLGIPTQRYLLRSGAEVSIWERKMAHVEILETDVVPNIPKHMHVDHCRAILWRLKSLQDNMFVHFEARWIIYPNGIQGYPSTGEHLEAQEWSDDHFNLMIGTEDNELLDYRAYKSYWMPERFQDLDWMYTEDIYLSDGLRLTFPALNEGEVLQTQFIVAYVGKGDDISPWYTVDMPYSDILSAAGCL